MSEPGRVVKIKKARRQRRRRHLDTKHSHWYTKYFHWIMLGCMFGAIGIFMLLLVLHPDIRIGAIMTLAALGLALLPYGAMVFLAPNRHRWKILAVYLAVALEIVVIFALLEWLL